MTMIPKIRDVLRCKNGDAEMEKIGRCLEIKFISLSHKSPYPPCLHRGLTVFQIMLRVPLCVCVFAAGFPGGMPSQAQSKIVPDGAAVEKVASGFRFTEGPVMDRRGNILFTDIPNNR